MNSDQLPEFERPPLGEVVLGVQFQALPGLVAPYLGKFWAAIGEDAFPTVEHHSPLDPVVETFSTSGVAVVPSFQMLPELPAPRTWFVDSSGEQVLQIQQDRFLRNWRKLNIDVAYPRYTDLRQRFNDQYRQFETFVAAEGLGEIRASQFEVTYINHIPAENLRIDEVTTLMQDAESSSLGTPEYAKTSVRYVIQGEEGQPIGRLHVSISPAIAKADNSPVYVLNLTARGIVGSSFDFLDVGHEYVVRGFADLTTPEMHKLWGRTDA